MNTSQKLVVSKNITNTPGKLAISPNGKPQDAIVPTNDVILYDTKISAIYGENADFADFGCDTIITGHETPDAHPIEREITWIYPKFVFCDNHNEAYKTSQRLRITTDGRMFATI